jgi:hypothetical protein
MRKASGTKGGEHARTMTPDLLVIYLNPFDQSTDNIAARLEISRNFPSTSASSLRRWSCPSKH